MLVIIISFLLYFKKNSTDFSPFKNAGKLDSKGSWCKKIKKIVLLNLLKYEPRSDKRVTIFIDPFSNTLLLCSQLYRIYFKIYEGAPG